MDPIFDNERELKKEYENLHKNILPKLNACGNRNIFKCKYCKKISVNCNMCRSARCKNCFEFNKSKETLLNSSNTQVWWYMLNFLTDYFSVTEVTKKFLNIDLNDEVKEKKCCLCL